jgi:hypothetical protein
MTRRREARGWLITAQIRNPNTGRAYVRATTKIFDWLKARGVTRILTSSNPRRIRSSTAEPHCLKFMERRMSELVKKSAFVFAGGGSLGGNAQTRMASA